jgi:hypothetical protein
VCRIHYVKSALSPANFDAVVKQNRLDCSWVHMLASKLDLLEHPSFDSYQYPEVPPLNKTSIRDPVFNDILTEFRTLAALHDEAVRDTWTTEAIEGSVLNKLVGLYLLAFALAVRFAKVHGELML